MNLLPREIQILRSKFLRSTREFLEKENFIEVDTPSFKKIVGMEPYLDPFIVHSESHEENGYLITSPEYSLKMALSSGLERVYEIAHCYRSGEKGSPIHTAEFLMLEFYASKMNEFDMMDCTIAYMSHLQSHWKNFGWDEIPVSRLTNIQVFEERTGRGWLRRDLEETLRIHSIPFQESDRYEDLYFLVFLNLIEPHLPAGFVFLYDYPPECAALAKVENGVARRFEIYWDQIEVANAFNELGDSTEQRLRLENEQRLRASLGKKVFDLDEDFLSCLDLHFPEATGISIGLDRLFMRAMKLNHLKDVSPYRLFFG
ncbi:amino acid--tRNA ligase-related protein [Leptospira sp. GIMC2001]|uniref:amino acid--tRNA ligase-related protein n=1 Tax=Leptospira sp. GIMC2001 TaxID=1513297 RepID=UPI00234BC270|nr:amino acid--tRNA ligase-related protein [Leptospira sp. GIMC2001]WCL47804.1 elongation factor P--(R)-beta-lysine ligase [Leptospira sp. GIMC2001]